MDIRKIYTLQKKAFKHDNDFEFEIDLILDETHPKWDWTKEIWDEYIEFERQRGNKVIYLTGK